MARKRRKLCQYLFQIGPNGRVVGVEHIPELVDVSMANVRKHHADLIEDGRLRLVEGDGRDGYAAEALYDAIHVGAAAEELPETLVAQLKIGGRMVLPVGRPGAQRFIQVDKVAADQITRKHLADVMYVPLTNRTHQLEGENY